MQRDDSTLLDISRSALLTQLFIEDVPHDDFLIDLKTQSSVLYQLLIIGEAVKRLSTDFRASHQEIPWSLMAGMRDHLIHAYDAVDWDEVWITVTKDIPELLLYLEPLLPKNPADENGSA